MTRLSVCCAGKLLHIPFDPMVSSTHAAKASTAWVGDVYHARLLVASAKQSLSTTQVSIPSWGCTIGVLALLDCDIDHVRLFVSETKRGPSLSREGKAGLLLAASM